MYNKNHGFFGNRGQSAGHGHSKGKHIGKGLVHSGVASKTKTKLARFHKGSPPPKKQKIPKEYTHKDYAAAQQRFSNISGSNSRSQGSGSLDKEST